MGLWFYILIVIFIIGWICERWGRKESSTPEREPLSQPERHRQTIEKSSRQGEFAPQIAKLSNFARGLNEISRISASLEENISLKLRVDQETNVLQSALSTEKILIDCAIEHAEYSIASELRRSAMTARERALFDEEFAKNMAHFMKTPDRVDTYTLAYKRPNFAVGIAQHDDITARAISSKIHSLKLIRDVRIAALNKKLENERFAKHFVEHFVRLGGPETDKFFKTYRQNSDITQNEGREREIARSEFAQVIKQEASNGSNALFLKNPEERSISVHFVKNSRRQEIEQRAKESGIPYLLHFTRIENLASIFNNGLCPVSALESAGTPFHANDRLRLDGQKDAVSLSISHPNDKMFAKYRWQNPEQRWAVLVLEPSIIWMYSVAFNRNNAADKRMSGLSRDAKMSVDAFDSMFLPFDDLPPRETNKLERFDPTDVQAELQVFDAIPTFQITGVVFHDADSLIMCKHSIGSELLDRYLYSEIRRLSVQADGKGFFGARAYARKTGWRY